MDLMIDLETLGTRANTAFLQIGAVVFDPNGDTIGDKFNIYINEIEGHVTKDTLMWWMQQSPEAISRFVNGIQSPAAVPLREALVKFVEFVKANRIQCVWSHGATFDIPIIETALSRYKLEAPWKFWNCRDTRTLYAIKGKPTLVRDGVHHDALDDAIYQAQCVQEVLQRG